MVLEYFDFYLECHVSSRKSLSGCPSLSRFPVQESLNGTETQPAARDEISFQNTRPYVADARFDGVVERTAAAALSSLHRRSMSHRRNGRLCTFFQQKRF